MTNWLQDAGHGGKDPGAVSHGNTEKDYTLEAAIYVDKRLADHGIVSDLSRTKDVTLDQGPRTAIACKYKKGISHHLNAGGGSGVEVIHSIFSDGKFEHMLIEEFRKAGYPVRPRPVFFKKWGSRDYYYMHRETGNCRMTILEYDFVDGPQAQKIKDKTYREGMYECVVRAICRDEGVQYKPLNNAQKVEADSADGKLTRGERGPNVRLLNEMLRKLTYTTKTDDLFDQYTEAALKAFQKDHGLPQDAVYTTAVGNVMLKAIAAKEKLQIDPLPKKNDEMYRLAKLIDSKNVDLIEELKKQGYYIVDTPK